MLRTKTITYNNRNISLAVPCICPYCGTIVSPRFTNLANLNYNENTQIALVTFYIECCQKLFFCTYHLKGNQYNFLYSYPSEQLKPLPDSIKEISPRFCELYNQCLTAESNNHLELAGSGFRNALEVLIKDYAITQLVKPKEEVKSKKLYQAIKDYMKTINLHHSAEVVRILGNDNTHYVRKYDQIGFDILKKYMEIFIQVIDTEYLISHPPVAVRDYQSE